MVILFSRDSCDFLFISQFILLTLSSNCLLLAFICVCHDSLSVLLCTVLISASWFNDSKKQTPWSSSASDRRLSAKLAPTFADRRCRMVSAMDPHGFSLVFLDRSATFSSRQLLNCTHEDPLPDPLLLRKPGSAVNRTRTSLTRGRLCSLHFLLSPASAVILRFQPRCTLDIFCPKFEIPVTSRAILPYLYPPGTRWPSYTLGH
jgi:hypothetical protein